jgi:hypothetical protein
MKRSIDVFVSTLQLISQLDIMSVSEEGNMKRSIDLYLEWYVWLTDESTDWLTDYRLDYLPCTSIKENYYNEDEFYNWIINDLLPHCNAFSARHSVIIMNNNAEHVNSRIKNAIETRDCHVKYLSLYSLDYNSIELSFEMLKN